MDKPKVLIITGALPYPLVTGAKIRTFNLMKTLADEFDIELLTVIASDADQKHLDAIEAAGIKCHYIRRGESKFCKIRDACLSFILSDPYLTRHYTDGRFRNKLGTLLSSKTYGVIHCDSISMTGNLHDLDPDRLILTQHNIEHIIWAGYADHATGRIQRLFHGNQYRKVKRLEEHLDRVYGNIVTVSQEDKVTLSRAYPSDRIVVVENGVDPETYSNTDSMSNRSGVIFTGSLDWYPNIDGLNWFVEEIYPELIALKPDCQTSIVGRRPARSVVRAIVGKENINLHPDVPEIQPYLNGARVMMVPLRIGGGSRLKILEAMAAKIPVVSTSKGAEGLAVKDGDNIIIEDNPKRFVAALVQIIQDDNLYRKLTESGRKLIDARYSWEKAARPLAELWKRVADA